MHLPLAAANASNTDGSAWGWDMADCELQLPFMCKLVPLAAYVYASNITQSTYLYNSTPSSFNEARDACNLAGGHLAYYDSIAEQAEVEQMFLHGGHFIPIFHR